MYHYQHGQKKQSPHPVTINTNNIKNGRSAKTVRRIIQEVFMSNKDKWTPKRICAILVIAFLIMIYLGTLIAAIFMPETGGRLFAICLFATVVVPIVAYIYIWIYTQATGKRTIASVPEIPGESEARKAKEERESLKDSVSEIPSETSEDTAKEDSVRS